MLAPLVLPIPERAWRCYAHIYLQVTIIVHVQLLIGILEDDDAMMMMLIDATAVDDDDAYRWWC